jgi:hypothetical protein
MMNNAFSLLVIVVMLSSCKKVSCEIFNPFTNNLLSNYKCSKSSCKSEEDLVNSFQCVSCVNFNAMDTTKTCDRVVADSLNLFYSNNSSMGKCEKVNVIVQCD